MSRDASFRRKVIYIAVVALLLYPLFRLGQPATTDSPGGVLAQLRTEHNLSQAQLGEIDPASETMKLATMGMRPFAVIMLWEKSNEYKMKEDWENFSATTNQITKLQPNFLAVWEFQAHNLSYNISVEFDDYRHRYHWVKKGISFLVEGTHYNRENPRLLHQIGWITGQKIGRADEHVQFRQMFRADEDFHNEVNREVNVDEALGYDGRPDNWLVGRLWYQRGQTAVDVMGMSLGGKSPLIYHCDAPMSLMNYASTIEEEGILGETAMRAWRDASVGWEEYGRRQIPTSWGHNVRLGDYNQLNAEIEAMEQEFAALLPGLREQIEQEKIDQLSPELREALKLTEAEWTEENYGRHAEAVELTHVTHREIARRAPADVADRAAKLAARLEEYRTLSGRTMQYRSIVNYDYWETRAEAEQTRTAVDAREFLYQARQLHTEASLEDAREMYEKAWHHWRQLYDSYPRLMDDVSADDLVQAIRRYSRLLQQLDQPLPSDFPLFDFLRRHENDLDEFLRQAVENATEAGDAPAGDEPADAAQPATTPEGEPSAPEADAEPAEAPAAAPAGPAEESAAKPASDQPEDQQPAVPAPAAEPADATEPAPAAAEDMANTAAEEPAAEVPGEQQPPAEEPAGDEPAEEDPAEAEHAAVETTEEASADDESADDESADEEPADTAPPAASQP